MPTRPPPARSLRAALDATARARILEEIAANGGKVPLAAKALGISRRGIYTWIDRLGIRVETGVEAGEGGAEC